MSEHTPRLIAKVIVVYDDNGLPVQLLLGFKQLRNKLRRAGFRVYVGLKSLSELATDADVIFTPTELAEAAQKAATAALVVPLHTYVNNTIYDEFVQRLNTGTEITASRVESEPSADGTGMIVRYRGNVRID